MLLRDLRAFAGLVWQDWKTTMSGIASIILAALGAAFPGLPAWSFWVAAMLCLFVAMFRVWQREHHEKQTLAARLAGEEFAADQRARFMAATAALTPSELEVLRRILRLGPMSDYGLQDHLRRASLPAADLGRLQAAGLIWKDHAAAWDVVPTFAAPLRELLNQQA
jgi:hypothetical protein